MTAPCTAQRPGFSLVELIVALTVLAVGLLALAGTSALAQRSFASAQATERAVRAAATVIDSLLREPDPAPGSRALYGAVVHWTVTADGPRTRFSTDVVVHDGAIMHRFGFTSERLSWRPPGE
jgi:prepilin-type N-terminal cleavage/methylation domain-containing protein